MKDRGLVRRVVTAVLVTGLAMTTGCGGSENDKTAVQVRRPEVAVITVAPERLELTTELPGRTSAYRVAEIRPQVNGLIQKRLFKEGSDVAAGDVLYRIDSATFRAACDTARASLARARAKLPPLQSRAERYRKLLKANAISSQEYDDAESAFRQAEADIVYWEAALKAALIDLEHTSVTAPISGRIGKSNITEGGLVTAHQPTPMATIQQLDPMYVDVPQSTTELLRLEKRFVKGGLNNNDGKQGEIKLILEDGSSYPLEGVLEFRGVTVHPSTGTVTLRAVFPNPEGILLPGMFVRAVVREGVDEAAILVPQEAVSRDPKGDPFVLIVNSEGTVEQRNLDLDRAIGNRWLVRSGVVPGDRIIVSGIQKVRPGAPVTVIDTDDKHAVSDGEAAAETAESH
ncbi:MAG: efflux transporter periplasmic adaptor subunit [delta proteobacterium MLS_D]|jgi:membrane fusion protein, multidrug efflux system|nr:MAG: efflux transporter periplasmic adaptor subunit [delta proteobacterium MLS_D]